MRGECKDLRSHCLPSGQQHWKKGHRRWRKNLTERSGDREWEVVIKEEE